MRLELPQTLRLRLTVVAMVPLVALVCLSAGIACWMIDSSANDTGDRILIGSARLISRAINHEAAISGKLLPLAVDLLKRRSAPVTYYSIYDGGRLVAGRSDLTPPPNYTADGHWIGPLQPEPRFRPTPLDARLTRGYVDPRDAQGVVQPAYLRDGRLNGHAVRIATEARRLAGNGHLVVVQVADFAHDRAIFSGLYIRRVLGTSLAVLLLGMGLFYSAMAWGLRPFAQLTQRIAANQSNPLHFQHLPLEDGPREAQMIAEAYNALMNRAERAILSLRQFTANASHQLRTPLAVLRVHLDVLETYGPASPQGQMALTDITASVGTLERLMQNLIALARLEERAPDADKRFSPADVVTDVIASRLPAARKAGVSIAFEGEDATALQIARGEAPLAAEMLGNLLDNAIAYNRVGGRVTLRLIPLRQTVRIEIEDDGPGIPLQERGKIWERFYRIPAGDDPVDGSGLGLPIVKAIAAHIGASVELKEGFGGAGTCAVIDFPLAT